MSIQVLLLVQAYYLVAAKWLYHRALLGKWGVMVKRVLMTVLIVLCGLIPITTLDQIRASAGVSIPRCSFGELEVASGWGSGAAAGSFGLPFVIVNTSHRSCYLKGFPKISVVTEKPLAHRITVIHSPRIFFAIVKPRRVNIPAGGVASFGVSGVDAMNQSSGNGASCTAAYFYTELPNGSSRSYENVENINICFSGFKLVVSAIEAGPSPKQI